MSIESIAKIKSRPASLKDPEEQSKIRTPDELLSISSERWTTENLGMTWPDSIWSDAADREVPLAELEQEFKDWRLYARTVLRRVQRSNLPLTLESMEEEFKRLGFRRVKS